MISLDQDALQCDLAETYHIYDYKRLSPLKVAIFSIGLRNESRIKLKMSNMNYTFDQFLLAGILDRLSLLVWSKTKDAEKGRNRPSSLFDQMAGNNEEDNLVTFESAEEFERKRRSLMKGG